MAFSKWEELLYGIRREECVLFLGPELPMRTTDGEPRVPAQDLAARLLDLQGMGGDDPQSGNLLNLASIAERVRQCAGDIRLEIEVTRWSGELEHTRSTLHEDLAALPFRLIVTGCHDPLMATALADAGKALAVERYHYRGRNAELLPPSSAEAPVLFYLYGHVGEPRSLVLTEMQLLDYLAALISKNPPLPNDLRVALTESRLFLFLGFGLKHWYLRILLHVLKVLKFDSCAFAIESFETAGGEPVKDTILFYQNFKVDIVDDDIFAFAAELRRRYEEAARSAGATPNEEATTRQVGEGPRVFICHASEDAEKAREIHDSLADASLRPWLDEESLRGGERWDEVIEATLIHDIDYFVVLNSRALAAKSREPSYVNKEIKVALRAADWRLGAFIIPVRVDETPLLPELQAYQGIEYDSQNFIRDLVRAVKRQVGAASRGRYQVSSV